MGSSAGPAARDLASQVLDRLRAGGQTVAVAESLTGAALICLSALGELPWWVTGLIMFRELGVTGLRFWVIRRGVIAASRGGKAKTLLQVIAICLYVLPASLSPPEIVRELFMAAAVVVTLVTGVDYVHQAMRRFGDRERFLALLDQIRNLSPQAGVRSNFIVGFPGETAADLTELELFLSHAGLDAIGIFGYSDEDGTEAASLPGQLDPAEISRRVEEFAGLADELMAQRAESRIGETVDVLIDEEADDDLPGRYLGRPAHQAPEVDGVTTVVSPEPLAAGDMVRAVVTGSEGVDLIADVKSR